jgi:hypothetical protein
VTNEEHRWWTQYMHGIDMCGGMSEEKKGDGAGHHGMTFRSRLPRVDGQGGSQFNDELCLADMEELFHRACIIRLY